MLVKRLALPKYGSGHKIQSVLKDTKGEVAKYGTQHLDASQIMNIKAGDVDRSTPHDEEDWQRLYEGIKSYDDVSGGEELNREKVIAASSCSFSRRWARAPRSA